MAVGSCRKSGNSLMFTGVIGLQSVFAEINKSHSSIQKIQERDCLRKSAMEPLEQSRVNREGLNRMQMNLKLIYSGYSSPVAFYYDKKTIFLLAP